MPNPEMFTPSIVAALVIGVMILTAMKILRAPVAQPVTRAPGRMARTFSPPLATVKR